MRIERLTVEKYGPLKHMDWQLPEVGVIYDDNMAGKTAIVDLLVQELLVTRKDSTTFQGYRRFGEAADVQIYLQSGNCSHQLGTEARKQGFETIFGWDEEELSRLLCIRAGDNDLVSQPGERSRMLNALASLVSGVGTEKIKKVDRDIRQTCNITQNNNWTDRKGTEHPKLKSRISEKIIPFLDHTEDIEESFRQLGQYQSRLSKIEEGLAGKRNLIDQIDDELKERRADKLERVLTKYRETRERIDDYSNANKSDLDRWKQAKRELEEAESSLIGNDEIEGEGLEGKIGEEEEKLRKLKRRYEITIEEKRNKLKSRLRELNREKSDIEDKIKREKQKVRDLFTKRLQAPMKKLQMKQTLIAQLKHWKENRAIYYGGSSIVLLLSAALGIIIDFRFFSISLATAFFVIFASYRAYLHQRLKQQTEGIRDDIRNRIRNELSEYCPDASFDVTKLANLREEILDQVPRTVGRENGLSEVEETIQSTENKLQQLTGEQSALEAEIEETRERLESYRASYTRQKQRMRKASQQLESLRNKTGKPTLERAMTDLEDKRKLEEKLDRLTAVLEHELETEFENNRELVTKTRDTITKLQSEATRSDQREMEIQDSATIEELRASKDEIQEEIRELEAELNQIQKKVNLEKDELRNDYSVDPEKPEEFFQQKEDYQKELQESILDRISGSAARQIIKDISESYIENLDRYFRGKSTHTVERFFSEVMGDELSVDFDYEEKQFYITENNEYYPETDLSTGARKHLFYSVRLALLERITSEPLFLLLDDPFLFYHEDRKADAIAQLNYLIDEGWQVICFTVDRQTKDDMVQNTGAKELSLRELGVD